MFTYAKNPNVGPIAGWHPHKDIESSKYVIDNVFNGAECYAICEKENNVAIGAVELKLNGYTDMTDKDDECELGYWLGEPFWVQEKLGFTYHHTCNEVPVPLFNEVRIGHTNVMTKEQWARR